MNRQFLEALFVMGGILFLLGACTFVTGWAYASHMYIVGATLVALVQLRSMLQPTDNKTLKRLRRQQAFGGLCLVVSGVMMVFLHHNEWMAVMMIAAVFEVYTAFRIPSEEKKDTESR